jgi:spore coat polysaccharide biosynthesis protein SpsF
MAGDSFTTIAIVQARMGSTRYPGKCLAEIDEWSLLGLLLARLTEARELVDVVVATSDNENDDAIETEAAMAGISCVRGPEDDVLARYALVSEGHPADLVVRICADNPLIDPDQVDALVRFAREGGYDLAYNHRPECGLPDGVGAEAITSATLQRLDDLATAPSQREHVTLYAYENPDAFRIARLDATNDPAVSPWQLDVDYPEDLGFIRALYGLLPEERSPLWTTAEIVATLEQHPELSGLRRQRETAS